MEHCRCGVSAAVATRARGQHVDGHAGEQAVAALRRFGVDVMFTLNGGHIWPLYEAARNQGVRVVDTRHEQTATFAAEAYAKLTRAPGPGRAHRRARDHQRRLGGDVGVVQRLAARRARRAGAAGPLGRRVAAGARPRADRRVDHEVGGDASPIRPRPATMVHEAIAPRRRRRTAGRCSSTSRSTSSARRPASVPAVDAAVGRGASPTPTPSPRLAALVAGAERPAFIVGSDVYWDGRVDGAARPPSSTCGCRASSTGSAAARCRPTTSWPSCAPAGVLKQRADLVVVLGTPLDFRLGFGRFGDGDGRPRRRRRRPAGRRTSTCRRSPATSPPTLRGARRATPATGADHEAWIAELRDAEDAARGGRRAAARGRRRPDQADAGSTASCAGGSARDAVVICDGGDFASYAGKFVEVLPARLLARHRPVRLPRQRAWATRSRPGSPGRRRQVVVLLGDGAAGFSLMDVDSLVRHGLPVVMVVGNNGMWGLEKHPMQAIYGWDVACDLQPGCRYDEVVRALGGAGETGHRSRARSARPSTAPSPPACPTWSTS